MILQRYWTGEIGGIALTDTDGEPCGFTLKGAEAFKSQYSGTSNPAASGRKHTQFSLLSNGKPIELSFLHIPAALADSLLDAFTVLEIIPGGGGLECEFLDGFQTITGVFCPDVPAWFDRGEPDGEYLKDFVLRLYNKPE